MSLIAPIVSPNDFCKGPSLIYRHEQGLSIYLHYSKGLDKADKAPWWMVAAFDDGPTYEGPGLYDIPEIRDARQFAGEVVCQAFDEGNLVVKA